MILTSLNPASITAGDLFVWIVGGVGAILLGVLGFYLKREKDRGDRTEADVRKLQETKASREEVKELSACVAKIKEDYITKEDFFREQAKMEKKLDRILDILIRKEKNDG
jgi:hypothetical protein